MVIFAREELDCGRWRLWDRSRTNDDVAEKTARDILLD